MTGNGLLQEVGAVLAFDPTETSADATKKAKVIRAINQAKDITVAKLKFVNIKYGSFACTASFLQYPFPDLDQMYVIWQTDTPAKLQRVSAWKFYNTFPNQTATGNPIYYVDHLGTTSGGMKPIGLYPYPSTAGGYYYCYYRALVPNILGTADYTTGTVTCASSYTITGSATTFTSAMVGRYIRIDPNPQWYKITSYVDATHLYILVSGTSGTIYPSCTTATYTISERFGVDPNADLFDVLVAMKAKHILLQHDRTYVDQCLEMKKEYDSLVNDYRSMNMSHLDAVDILSPEDSYLRPSQIEYNLKDYDIYQ